MLSCRLCQCNARINSNAASYDRLILHVGYDIIKMNLM